MRTRTALLVCLALVLPSLGTGCRMLCGIEQWKCDTFGTCGFGTQPSYGRFAPPGPMPPPTLGAPSSAPPQTFQSGPVLGAPTDISPSSPGTIPSF